MNRPDHETFREWLYLEADGELSPDRHGRLETHVAGCPDCRREREELQAVDRLLERNALPVRDDFRANVMSALPPVAWEARHLRTWTFPAAVFLLFAGVAAALMAFGSTGPTPSGLSALYAVAGLLRAATLAGAGLLGASWKGLGMAFSEVLASPVSLGVCAFVVICLNLLLISLVRRRRPAPAPAALTAKDLEPRKR